MQVHATLYVGVSEFDNNKMSNVEGPFKFKDLPLEQQKALRAICFKNAYDSTSPILNSYCKKNKLKIDKVKSWVTREKSRAPTSVNTITSHLGTYGQGIFLILSSLSPSFSLSLSCSCSRFLSFLLSFFRFFFR